MASITMVFKMWTSTMMMPLLFLLSLMKNFALLLQQGRRENHLSLALSSDLHHIYLWPTRWPFTQPAVAQGNLNSSSKPSPRVDLVHQ